jgi:NADH-quinone oxidoreductase subunit N
MVVAGLGFRITAVPFHFYAPDVYQGAPTVGAALLAFIPKVAGFAALLRVLGFVTPAGIANSSGYIGMALSTQVPIILWFLAVLTMSLGNILALWQDNLKRLLAYSSVAHAGYMLIGLAVAPYLRGQDTAGSVDGVEAILYYLVAYGAMTVGAFAVLAYLDSPQSPVETVDDLGGLSQGHPILALLMTVFLFSLIGIPLTAGFTGKFLVFFGAMAVPPPQAAHARALAILGMINAAIGGWYYLRIVAVMYLRNPLRTPVGRRTWPALATLGLCLVLTVGLSVPPGAQWLVQAAREAAGVKSVAQGR